MQLTGKEQRGDELIGGAGCRAATLSSFRCLQQIGQLFGERRGLGVLRRSRRGTADAATSVAPDNGTNDARSQSAHPRILLQN